MIRKIYDLSGDAKNALYIALLFANFTSEIAQIDFDGFSVIISPGQKFSDVLADYNAQKSATEKIN